MAKKRIILADDHRLFRAGLESLIAKESDLTVVAQANDGKELIKILRQTPCDLVVLDLSMPYMDGVETIQRVRKAYPKVKILVLTMQKDYQHLKHAMAGGANGYIVKEDAYEQLLLAIKLVLKGKKYISPSMSAIVTDRFIRSSDDTGGPSLEILTKREKEILRLIANGLANKNIAAKLRISIRTVEAHRANLTDKLGIKNTASLVKYAIAKGLV